jgi:hypothetical protein
MHSTRRSHLDITVSFDEDQADFSFTGGSAFTIDSATMSRQLGLKDQLPTASGTTYTALTQVCDFAGATKSVCPSYET